MNEHLMAPHRDTRTVHEGTFDGTPLETLGRCMNEHLMAPP